jgi:hypothetical protein
MRDDDNCSGEPAGIRRSILRQALLPVDIEIWNQVVSRTFQLIFSTAADHLVCVSSAIALSWELPSIIGLKLAASLTSIGFISCFYSSCVASMIFSFNSCSPEHPPFDPAVGGAGGGGVAVPEVFLPTYGCSA